jgi:DNA repair exonuclease SbcCD ATPase subunit
MNVSRASFDFDHRLAILSGRSGQGKSAIFESISVCLTSKKRSNTYTEYIKQGADRALIHLEAIVSSEPTVFDVSINSDKRQGTFSYTIQHKGQTYKNNDATDLLKSFDIEYYAGIIFSMQYDQDVVDLSPSARSLYLQRLLNFDFEEQKQRVRDDITQLTQTLNKVTNDIAIKDAVIKSNTQKLKVIDELSFTPVEYEQITQRINDTNTVITSLKLKQADNAVKRMEAAEIAAQLHAIDLSIYKIDTEITQLLNAKKQHDEIKESIAQFNAALTELTTKIAVYDKDEETMTAKFNAVKLKIAESTDVLNTRSKELSELNGWKKLIDEGVCPHCGQETTDHVAEMYERIKGESFSNDAFNKKIDEVEKIIDGARQSLDVDIDVADNTERLLNDLRTKRAVDTNSLQTTANSIKEFCKRLDEIVYDEDSKTQLSLEKRRQIGEKNKLLDKERVIQDAVDESVESEIARKNAELESMLAVLKTYVEEQSQRERDEFDNKRIEDENESLEIERAELVTKSGEINSDLTSRNEALKILEKDLPNYMIIKTCDSLQSEMNDFIHGIFPDYEVRLESSKKGTDFFYTKTKSLPENATNKWITSRMSSGFERAALTMSFKYALCKMYGLSFILLDECDKNADDESSEKLFDAITGDSLFDQLFVVSHKRTLCQYLLDNVEDHIMYTAKRGAFTETESAYDD